MQMTTDTQQRFFGYFGLSENPFHVSPNPRFYHSTPAHDSARQELLFGLQTRQGLLVLTGEAGTGKTTLLNSILDSLARRGISTAYVFHPLLEPIELLECILRDFGVKYSSTRKVDLLGALQTWLIAREALGDCPVVVVDEAQSLTLHMLDELRLLLNMETPHGKLLQIILAGQTKLEDKLHRPELRQLRQRVMFHCKLTTLSEEQTAAYVQTRLSHAGLPVPGLFPPEALQCIYMHAKGIPRVINLLCEHALITAFGEQQHSIAAEAIQRIAVDFDLSANPLSVESQPSIYHSGRFHSFSLAEARLEDLLPLDKPSPVAAPKRIDEEVEQVLADLAAAPATPQFVAAESIAMAPEPSTSAGGDCPPSPVSPRPQEVHSYWRRSHSRVQLPRPIQRTAEVLKSYWRAYGRTSHTHVQLPRFIGRIAQAFATYWQAFGRKSRTRVQLPRPIQRTAEALKSYWRAYGRRSHTQVQLPRFIGRIAQAFATYWQAYGRKSRTHVELPRFIQRTAEAITSYWREVCRSFVRDGRYLLRPLATSTQPQAIMGSGKQQSVQSHNLLHPVANWLRRPLVPRRLPAQNRRTRSSSTK
jgi:general secretion pathway protein A